ncbi:MAG: restriction endonuclease subunit S [Leptolyngbyaceae cyanobacterium bins.349]|nr:restriction endonuclease subunit S [Leptolyngbyaceae cyanobacterium bins.349]
MDFKTFLEHFDTIAQAPNGIAKLRSLILDLAVRGKLVPQNPEDEPASVLLDKAQFLKEQSNNQKKKKKLTISPDEILFDAPNGWVWIRLEEVVESMANGIYKPDSYYCDDGVACLRMYNIDQGKINFRNLKRMNLTNDEIQQYKLQSGDLLVNRVNSRELVGKAAVIPDINEPLIFESKNIRVRLFESNYLPKYLCNLFQTRLVRETFEGDAKQTTGQASINQSQVSNIVIPLPPLAEQKRIVEKVDELMALCDRLQDSQETRDQLRQKLRESAIASLMNAETDEELQKNWAIVHDNWHTLSQKPEDVNDLRRSICQLAVRGKLSSQDSTDQPSSKLLEEVRSKKELLIQNKEIPKTKNIGLIEQSETIYKIPHNWSWARLGEITKVIEYGTSEKASEVKNTVPMFRMNNIQNGRLIFDNLKYVSESIKDLPKLYLKDGDLLFNRTNSYELVGKTGLFRGQDNQYTFASYLIRITLFKEFISPEFVNLSMNSAYFRQTQIEPEIVQQCGQANFNGTKLQNTLIPLPPLAEQKRIVAKVDEMMQMCEQLEESLRQSQQKVEALVASAISHLTF